MAASARQCLCASAASCEKRTISGQPCEDAKLRNVSTAAHKPAQQKTLRPGGARRDEFSSLTATWRAWPGQLCPEERSVGHPPGSAGAGALAGQCHPSSPARGSQGWTSPRPAPRPLPRHRLTGSLFLPGPLQWAGSCDLHPALPCPGCQVSAHGHVPSPSHPPHSPPTGPPSHCRSAPTPCLLDLRFLPPVGPSAAPQLTSEGPGAAKPPGLLCP